MEYKLAYEALQLQYVYVYIYIYVCILYYIYIYLVGGLEHEFYFSIQLEIYVGPPPCNGCSTAPNPWFLVVCGVNTVNKCLVQWIAFTGCQKYWYFMAVILKLYLTLW